ncbi:MAG TPA: amino acid permease [Gemmatimonadaceae bacterium]|nr:amino acid permease [Gemmatimonadaceae bacterium]
MVAYRARVPLTERIAPIRRLTLLGVVALAVGNMVGTSIWTLPATMAKAAGPLALAAWAITAVGYFFIARTYSRLGTRWPKTGGPYVYVREAFGDFAGFQTVWSYWLSATIGNAAIVTAVVGYATGFSDTLRDSPMQQFVLAQLLLWGFCVLNTVGVQHSARLQVALMFLTVVPLVIGAVVALPQVRMANLTPFAPQGWSALAPACALVVWAFSGVESATVPADEVQGSAETVGRGTMLGYWIATLVFLLTALMVIGTVPTAELAESPRPIALAMARVVGPWAAIAIGIVALGSNLATLNGWVLMAGRIPVTAAQDGLFFAPLGRLHPRFATPHVAMIVGTLIPSALLLLYFSQSLLGVFSFVALLAILTTLLPHLYTCAAELLLVRRHPDRYTATSVTRVTTEATIGFLFVLWTMYGVGPQTAMWGFLAIVAGTPLYAWLRRDAVAR